MKTSSDLLLEFPDAYLVQLDYNFPIIRSLDKEDPITFLKNYQNLIEKVILSYGGILLRDFSIHAASAFNKFASIICTDLMDYVYRSTPRTKLGGKVYTATEYPASRHIPLHNEFSYFHVWPKKIMFFCMISSKEGGETPIANCHKVLNRIDKKIIEKFDRKGVMYVRNYTKGIDLSWQEVFQTEDKGSVEQYCRTHGIEFEWRLGALELMTSKTCQATTIHPETQNKVWFNQAHLFHASSLSKEERSLLVQELGENNLPRNSFYGDGSSIEEADLEHIRDAYEKEMIAFKWQRGDLMVLDNVLMAHGRKPYFGERKIVVAMG